MPNSSNVHEQFAGFFEDREIRPFVQLLSQKLSDGHICIDPDKMAEREDPDAFLKAHPLVTSKEGPKRPFVWHRNRLYFQRYFHYESGILERIRAFLNREQQENDARRELLLKHREQVRLLFGAGKDASDKARFDWQMAAALMALSNSFTIISGGPGTGKTTTVAKILALLFSMQPNVKVALAAPTGKAAYRMAESLKNASQNLDPELVEKFAVLEPQTLHRLLKARGTSNTFEHNASYPLQFDLLIVDEASMIDVALFYRLMDALPDTARLILLGDKDQLASVEAGSVLGDLCQTQEQLNGLSADKVDFINSFLEAGEEQFPEDLRAKGPQNALNGHVVQLKYSHRFSGDKGIGLLSQAIIHNQSDAIAAFLAKDKDEAVKIDQDYRNDCFEDFVAGYEAYIKEPDLALALKKLNHLRVLCAIREGEQGVNRINKRIEEYLQRKGLLDVEEEFYLHRPVMVLQNNPALGLFNGDAGIVRKDEKGISKVWFEDARGCLKSFIPGHIGAVETIFATTIHKSQGSEFNKVLVLLPNFRDLPLLTRELVYTAITRARSFVLLQASAEVLSAAAERRVERVSGLAHRIDELI